MLNDLQPWKKGTLECFPGGSVVKDLSAGARDMGLIPGPGMSRMPRSN